MADKFAGPALACLLLLAATVSTQAADFALVPFAPTNAPEIAGLTAAKEAAALGRGANFGGLEAPSEGAWGGIDISEDEFVAAAQGGFSTVRLPVRFSNHAAANAPYKLDEAFMQRVDFAIEQALGNGLNIIIDFHHYHQMDGDPLDDGEFKADLSDQELRERYVAIWQQVAARYRSLPTDKVLFELYNEPHGNTATVWNPLLAEALKAIRQSNPFRFVLVDPVNWSTPSGLDQLRLPADDQRLIVDVHSYEPYHFTMQGADWIEGSAAWRGTPCCDSASMAAINGPLDVAADWSKQNNRPVMLGEFGSNSQAPLADRVSYTEAVRAGAEARGFSWAYWDFISPEFGPRDAKTGTWRPGGLYEALVPAK